MSNIVFNDKCLNSYLDIKNMNWKNIKKNGYFAIKIDLDEIKLSKKIIKKILKLRIKTIKNKNVKNDFNGNAFCILNFNENNEKHSFFIKSIEAILLDNKKSMYEYIYDETCNYLDSNFYGKNLCNFNNNKCGAKKNTSCSVGCCRHYKNRFLGPLKINYELVKCEYLKDYRCSAKCLPCKLFTCDYLEKKGVRFKIKDIFLLDTFFNPIQKITLKFAVYNTKEIIIKRLIVKSYLWI